MAGHWSPRCTSRLSSDVGLAQLCATFTVFTFGPLRRLLPDRPTALDVVWPTEY